MMQPNVLTTRSRSKTILYMKQKFSHKKESVKKSLLKKSLLKDRVESQLKR